MRPFTKSTTKHSPLRQVVKGMVWILLTILLAIAFAAAWAWSNRYELIERQTITYFDSLGIQADLKIHSASGKIADIRDIRLAYDEKPFLKVNRLQAAYQWRDLLNGVVERIDFTEVTALITVDETGAIIDGWRPPSSDGGSAFPIRGIGVTEADILLQTPFGDVPLTGDADIKSPDTFDINGQIAPSVLTRDDLQISAAGPFAITAGPDAYGITLSAVPLSLVQPSGALRGTQLTLDAQVQKDTGIITGTGTLKGGAFDAQAGIAGRIGTVNIDGRWDSSEFTANIDTDLTDVSIIDAKRRDDLARTLSLSNALADIPVVQNFTPSLNAPIRDLLAGSDIKSALSITVSETERRVTLRGPVTLRTRGQTQATLATLDPVEAEPFYHYNTDQDGYEIIMQASLSRPVPLTLDPLRVRIRSTNGISVEGVAAASGRIRTRGQWRTQTEDGRPARMGPVSAEFDYTAPIEGPSRLILIGAADYDGDIPGGYVRGLKAGGTLNAQLRDDRTQVNFNPDRAITIARLDTMSDWDVTSFKGQLEPASPLYMRRGTSRATVKTALIEASLTASRPATDEIEAASMDVKFGRADLSGDILSDSQSWNIGFTDLAVQSDTVPVAGTDLVLPQGDLSVGLSADGPFIFALTAPDSTLITPAYSVRGMAVDAAGTTEQYELSYKNGRVKMLTENSGAFPVPVLPLSGQAVFDAGELRGTAQTTLPRAPSAPIDITYRVKNGQGDADIDIRNLRFVPGGLQPQDFAPALRGKIAQVDGAINADLRVIFGTDIAPTGTGTVEIVNMSLGTAPGPVTGLSGTVRLTSLFPVVTAPDQQLSIKTFNPGFPLENGELTYALVTEGVAISRAVFPLGEGQVSFDPFTWTYGATENRVTLRVGDVEVGDFLQGVGSGRLVITGALEGKIPVVVRGIDVLVENGRLEVKNGGVIQYKGKEVADAIPNEYAAKAIEALKNFNYDALFMEINGPLDGEIKLGLQFTGSNPEVFYNIPFQFDVTVEGELFNIARSLNPNGLQQRILTSVKENNAPK